MQKQSLSNDDLNEKRDEFSSPSHMVKAWNRRAAKQHAEVLFNAGRLTNCYRFHASRAFLLDSKQQFEIASWALTELSANAVRLKIERPDLLSDEINERAESWRSEFFSEGYFEELDSAIEEHIHIDDERHASRLVDLLKLYVEPLCWRIRTAFEERLCESDRAILRLGEIVDLGVRPRSFHSSLTTSQEKLNHDENSEDELASLENWQSGKLSSPDPVRNLNIAPLVPGNACPSRGWASSLVAALEIAGIKTEKPTTSLNLAKPIEHTNIVELVDEIDLLVRNALHDGPDNLIVDEDQFRVVLGDRVCFFGNTAEFRFINLLDMNLGRFVTHDEIEEAIGGGERSPNTIASLKRRVCKKLKQNSMSDLAKAIESQKGHYRLVWPPSTGSP